MRASTTSSHPRPALRDGPWGRDAPPVVGPKLADLVGTDAGAGPPGTAGPGTAGPGTATGHGYRGCCELGTITLKGVSPHSCAVAPAVAPRPSPSSSLHGFPFDTPSPAVVVLPAARPRHDGSAQQQGEIAPGDKFALLRRGGTEPFLQPHLSQRRRYPLPSLLSRTFALH